MELIDRMGRLFMLCWVLLVVAFVILPYLLWGEVRDFVLRQTRSDVVWIQELNPHFWGVPFDDKSAAPEYPLVTEFDDHNLKYYYVRLGSLPEAESWLQSHGYSKREVVHRNSSGSLVSKMMPVKMVGERESILNVIVDYGDRDCQFLTFRYPDKQSPLNMDRLPAATTEGRPFRIYWASTDGHGSHMFGQVIVPAYPGQDVCEGEL